METNRISILHNPRTTTVALDDKKGRLAERAKIDSYEVALKKLFGSEKGDMDEINDNGLTEYLIGGAYTRVLKIPAGVSIVSHIWNRERLWIIISGKVTVTTETSTETIEAPYIGHPPLGSKTALYAHEDTLWAAVTGCTETEDVDEVEDIVKAKDYTEVTYPWDKIEHQEKQP